MRRAGRAQLACSASLRAMPVAAPRHRLDGAGDRVAAEQHVAGAGELGRLDHLGLGVAVQDRDLGAGGDVAAGLDHAVVAERDADAGVGAEQAALPDRDDLLAAAGQGAHDRGAAADVGAVADHDAGADPALHHRGAQRAGVVVDEALVHHGGAGREVGAEADPVGVGHAYAGRQHVVGHPGELVHAEDLHRTAGRAGPAGSPRSRRPGRGRGWSRRRWRARRRCRPC